MSFIRHSVLLAPAPPADDIEARLAADLEPEYETVEPLEPVQTFTLRAETPLSPRERQVAIALANGATNREIAELYGLSVKTVDTHRAHVLEKLEVRNNSALTRYAIQTGLIPVYP